MSLMPSKEKETPMMLLRIHGLPKYQYEPTMPSAMDPVRRSSLVISSRKGTLIRTSDFFSCTLPLRSWITCTMFPDSAKRQMKET